MRAWLRTALYRTGLLGVARRGRNLLWTAKFADANRQFLETWSDGLPVPPPPLPFADRQFAVVYALSVFTHLPEPLQNAWMQEIRRVVRPGGHVILTTHGAHYLNELDPDDRTRFASGQLVIKREDRPGSNVCGAYHPEAYVRDRLAHGFTVVDFVAEGAAGNP